MSCFVLWIWPANQYFTNVAGALEREITCKSLGDTNTSFSEPTGIYRFTRTTRWHNGCLRDLGTSSISAMGWNPSWWTSLEDRSDRCGRRIEKPWSIFIHVGKTTPFAPSPSHHHVYRWYGYHSQSWVVYDIVLPTWSTKWSTPKSSNFIGFSWIFHYRPTSYWGSPFWVTHMKATPVIISMAGLRKTSERRMDTWSVPWLKNRKNPWKTYEVFGFKVWFSEFPYSWYVEQPLLYILRRKTINEIC